MLVRPYLVRAALPLGLARPVSLPKGSKEATGLSLSRHGTVFAVAFSPGRRRFTPFFARGSSVTILPYDRSDSGLGNGQIDDRGDAVATLVRPSYPFRTEPRLWIGKRAVVFPSFEGWALQSATGINAKGQICGTGLHDGRTRAYVLSPISGAG